MKKFLRNYSIASLTCIFLAAVAIFVTYRAIVIRSTTAIAEGSSVTVARVALNPIRPYLADYLEAAGEASRDPTSVAMPMMLQDAIAEMMRDSYVTKLKVYTRTGMVLFSTETAQIGSNQSDNRGFREAMGGEVSVAQIYRDSFNPFDQVTEDDNLVQTYIPVRRRPTDPIVGVFEMYTDMNALVNVTESSELKMIAAIALILTGLFAALLLLVHRSHDLIETQQRTIREKTALLERLSRESLRREDGERKRVAIELHEGLAQTLSAIKLAVETARADSSREGPDPLESVVPDLQNAIGQTRTIAMELRPSGLDDLGLGPTLDALCRDFEEENPGIRAERRIAVQESSVPAPLRIVVYRIVQAALKIVGIHPEVKKVRIEVEASSRALTLGIQDNAAAIVTSMRDEDELRDPHSPYWAVRERVIISGGKLSVVGNTSGGPILRVSWLL